MTLEEAKDIFRALLTGAGKPEYVWAPGSQQVTGMSAYTFLDGHLHAVKLVCSGEKNLPSTPLLVGTFTRQDPVDGAVVPNYARRYTVVAAQAGDWDVKKYVSVMRDDPYRESVECDAFVETYRYSEWDDVVKSFNDEIDDEPVRKARGWIAAGKAMMEAV